MVAVRVEEVEATVVPAETKLSVEYSQRWIVPLPLKVSVVLFVPLHTVAAPVTEPAGEPVITMSRVKEIVADSSSPCEPPYSTM